MEDDSQDFQDFWGFGEDGLRWAWWESPDG
jgi:hypothetical protein